jgi:PAS domain S-box-containing protein
MSDEVPAGVGPELDRTALVIADRRGRIAFWSPGATGLFGYAAEAMVGEAVSVLVPAAFRRRHTAGFRAAWATGVLEPSGAVMIPVVCADGETRSYASHIFPIRDPHRELLAVCAAWSPPHDRDASLRPLD